MISFWPSALARFIVALTFLVAAAYHAGASAQVSVVGASTTSTGATAASALTVNAVAGAQRADLLVVQLTLDDGTANVTPPTGWTELSSIAQVFTTIQQRVYWTVRSNTAPASYTFNFSKAVRGALILTDFAGVDTAQAINAFAGGAGSGTTLVAPEVAAAYNNTLLVSFFGTTGTAAAIVPQGSMTVPVNGQAIGGTVRMAVATELLGSDGLTGIRTATGSTGSFVTQTLSLTAAPATLCFSDNFNRATLGADWVASTSRGAFTPVINAGATGAQRLQLTQNVVNQSTLATLQRQFPAGGNLVVVNYRHFAYPRGGANNGADGIVTIFSDANVPPVSGGSGGSMGYAQYNSPANTPGFAGGWLGVGIDEFGNFSSASENRSGGPGQRANSISIRGPSNSFYSAAPANTYARGYPYITGTGSLVPIIGSTALIADGGGPGFLYRITIDSRVPGEQWLQVERSTNNGATYTAEVPLINLMSSLSTIFAGQTLPPIPSFFWLSLSSGTGGSTNIHEIDDLSVCASKLVPATPAIDHFRFENPGSMDTCLPATIKVTACTAPEPACNQFTGGDVNVTLRPAGWVGGDTVKLINGSGTLQLARSATGTVALDIDKTKTIWPALINAVTSTTACVVPGTNTATSCNLNVSASTAGFSVTFPSPSQIACNSSGDINIKACAAGYANTLKNLQFWFNYTDPATPAAGSPVMQFSRDLFATSVNLGTAAPSSVVTPTPVSVNFDSTATAKVRVRYDDVGRLTLQLRDSAATSVTGSGSVIVRPATFAVTSVTDQAGSLNNPGASDATGTRFIAAGRSFKVTAEARNNCSTPAAVRNFGRESSSEGIRFDATLAPGLGLTNNPALVTVTDFSFTNGSGTATLQWPEAGILRLTPRLKSGNYLGGSVDVIGTSTGNVGRFFADRLDTVVNTQGCSLGGFTYDRQPLPRVTLTAKAATGETLRNYVGSSTPTFNFAKTVSLTDNTGNGTLAPSIPSQAFAAGVGVLDGVDANHPRATFSFNTSPSAPAAIGIVATDSDAGPGTAIAGSANVRSGRLRMPNAYGSDRLALPIPIEAQFWTGTAWATNTLDSCTTLPLSAMVMGPYVAPLAACTTWLTPSSVTLNAGRPLTAVQLTRPDVNGSVTLTLNTSATASGNTCLSSAASSATAANLTWFGQPTARATFGIYRSPLIYRRENY